MTLKWTLQQWAKTSNIDTAFPAIFDSFLYSSTLHSLFHYHSLFAFLQCLLNICRKFESLISQGSGAMCLRCGGYCHIGFVANFIRFPAVQKIRKSVKIWQSCLKVGTFFWDTVHNDFGPVPSWIHRSQMTSISLRYHTKQNERSSYCDTILNANWQQILSFTIRHTNEEQ